VALVCLIEPPNILIKLNKISNLIELGDIYSLNFQFVLGFLEYWSLLFRGALRAYALHSMRDYLNIQSLIVQLSET